MCIAALREKRQTAQMCMAAAAAAAAIILPSSLHESAGIGAAARPFACAAGLGAVCTAAHGSRMRGTIVLAACSAGAADCVTGTDSAPLHSMAHCSRHYRQHTLPSPASCARPHAAWPCALSLQGSEEAQAVFVTTGGLDMLLRRCLHHVHAAAAADSDGTAVPPDLLHRLFVFLQLFLGWVLGEAVRRGEPCGSASWSVTASGVGRLCCCACAPTSGLHDTEPPLLSATLQCRCPFQLPAHRDVFVDKASWS